MSRRKEAVRWKKRGRKEGENKEEKKKKNIFTSR